MASGYVQMLFAVSSNAAPQVQSGTMRAIAITSPQRSSLMPDVPTFTESGFPDFIITGWGSFVAPAGTPKSVVGKLSADMQSLLRDPEVKLLVQQRGGMDAPGVESPEAFARFIEADIDRWNRLIDLAGVSRGKPQSK